jgi:hypothetical protein
MVRQLAKGPLRQLYGGHAWVSAGNFWLTHWRKPTEGAPAISAPQKRHSHNSGSMFEITHPYCIEKIRTVRRSQAYGVKAGITTVGDIRI